MAGKIAADLAVLLKGVITFYLGTLLVGMTEASGQFVAVDPDLMLSGQRLKFGESWESSQWMSYGEGHDAMLTVARLVAPLYVASRVRRSLLRGFVSFNGSF